MFCGLGEKERTRFKEEKKEQKRQKRKTKEKIEKNFIAPKSELVEMKGVLRYCI